MISHIEPLKSFVKEALGGDNEEMAQELLNQWGSSMNCYPAPVCFTSKFEKEKKLRKKNG